MSLVLRKDPDWLETLCSTDVSGGALTLLGKDGCQVPVPAALLVAVSPLVKSIMSDLLPPAFSPHVISIPAVTADVLLKVAEIFSKGTADVHANKGKVLEVFKMMRIEAFLSCCVADMEVKDEDLPEVTEDCSQSEIYVKIEKSDENKESEYYEDYGNLAAIKVKNKKMESNLSGRNNSSAEVLLPSNESKPEENNRDKECDKNVLKKNVRAASSVYLKQHVLVHTGEKPFACDECAHRAVSRARLKQHKLVHSREKPFACDQCSYRAVSRGLLKQHMQIHIKEKPFACDQDDYKNYRHSNLVSHKLYNHGADKRERSFACDECDYRAVSRGNLVSHKAYRHSGERPFACDQCSYRAVRREQLNRHIQTSLRYLKCHRTHELKPTPKVDEPVHCIHCGKLCKSKKRFEKHMERMHSGLATPKEDEPVHCKHCGKLCKGKKRLENHMQRRHSGLANLT